MLDFDDPIWDRLEGGYQIPYNPVPALRRLERASTHKEESKIFKELWGELHHQGDLGVCSYACVPQLVRIAESRPPMTFDFFALIAVIEIERHERHNPKIPRDLKEDYSAALKKVPQLIDRAVPPRWDQIMIGATCSALAASKGNRLLARAYLEMSEDNALEFLREKTGYEP